MDHTIILYGKHFLIKIFIEIIYKNKRKRQSELRKPNFLSNTIFLDAMDSVKIQVFLREPFFLYAIFLYQKL